MTEPRTCDTCGSILVSQIRQGETRSNKESSIKYVCPNSPHTSDDNSDTSNTSDPDKESLDSIADKYDL